MIPRTPIKGGGKGKGGKRKGRKGWTGREGRGNCAVVNFPYKIPCPTLYSALPLGHEAVKFKQLPSVTKN